MWTRLIPALSVVILLQACADRPSEPRPTPAVVSAGPDAPRPEPRPARAEGPIADVRLGTTVASLGDPTEAGLWLKTPLVDLPGPGRVTTEGGASTKVDLIPL